MNDAELNRLREAAWQRELTPKEKAQLSAALSGDPATATECRLEAALGRSLRRLPPPAVPSNFTACVLQALAQGERTTGTPNSPWGAWLKWRRWLPRVAVAGMVCGTVLLGWRHHQTVERRELADSVHDLTTLAAAPASGDAVNVEVWKDFDIIRRMSGAAGDDELLTVAKTQQ